MSHGFTITPGSDAEVCVMVGGPADGRTLVSAQLEPFFEFQAAADDFMWRAGTPAPSRDSLVYRLAVVDGYPSRRDDGALVYRLDPRS